MAVLVEAICAIVRREAAEARFNGGLPELLRTLPNAAVCHDADLVRVGFMDTADADAYVGSLEAGGLIYVRDDDETVDVALVVQSQGPTRSSPWLAFEETEIDGMTLSLCWGAGSTPETFAAPPGWRYDGSLSATGPGFMPTSAIGDRLRFLRRDGGVDVFLDLQTNREVYSGRPRIHGDTLGALETQIDAAMYETLAIGERGAVPTPRFWRRADPRYARLKGELLPIVERIANGPGRALMSAHLTLGVILRLLGRLPDAEKSLRQAHALAPETVAPLRDLVRCLAEQRRPHDALPFAREAVRIDSTDAAALGNLAACLMQCGENDEAVRVIERALELDPTDAINKHIRRRLRRQRRTS